MPGRILIIDDDVDICFLLGEFFEEHGYETARAFRGVAALKALKEGGFDLVLSDYRLPDIDGFELLKEIRAHAPKLPVIVITGYSDVKTAVNVIKFGAFDYVTKPILPEEILAKAEEALRQGATPVPPAGKSDHGKQRGNGRQSPAPNSVPGFLEGVSRSSRCLQEHISLVGPTNMTVVLQGETGVGKEVAARAIHTVSRRADRPFYALNCGALPENLAVSELFGHKKGAFTDASADKDGMFIVADGGTLFLDEIVMVSPVIQVQLLRVLEEKQVRRIGETGTRPVDVRLIVATNEDLQTAVEGRRFREDLFHRLNEFAIRVPALREREEDILRFAKFFLESANRDLGRQVEAFEPEAENALLSYAWPGNVRELRNVVKRSVLLCREKRIATKHFPPDLLHAPKEARHNQSNAATDLRSAADRAEGEAIIRALKEAGYNKTRAAKALNIDRKTLYNKMKSLNLT